MGLQHRMLRLPFVLVLLVVVGQNHAKPSSIGEEKLLEFRVRLEPAEKAGDVMLQGDDSKSLECDDVSNCVSDRDASETGNAGNDNAITATKGVAPTRPAHVLDNTAGDSTKEPPIHDANRNNEFKNSSGRSNRLSRDVSATHHRSKKNFLKGGTKKKRISERRRKEEERRRK